MRTIAQIEASAGRAWARNKADEQERAIRQELMRKPSPGDARLVRPTLVRCLRSFCVGGQPVQIGASVTVPWDTAQSLMFIGKAELL